MSLRLFHQSGHCANWNRDSFEKDRVGNGIIFSPVHETCTNVSEYSKKLKSASLFDPQFYLPSSQKQKLQSYSFFPNTIMGEKVFQLSILWLYLMKQQSDVLHFSWIIISWKLLYP